MRAAGNAGIFLTGSRERRREGLPQTHRRDHRVPDASNSGEIMSAAPFLLLRVASCLGMIVRDVILGA